MLDEGRAVAGGSNCKMRRIDNLKPVNQVCTSSSYNAFDGSGDIYLLFCMNDFLMCQLGSLLSVVDYVAVYLLRSEVIAEIMCCCMHMIVARF